jgi:hypothetical protein
MEGEANLVEALQSGETGRIQLLKLCLWYSDNRAHATGHCLSAALLYPGSPNKLSPAVRTSHPPGAMRSGRPNSMIRFLKAIFGGSCSCAIRLRLLCT